MPATNWKKARKKPVVVEYREVEGDKEVLETLEGEMPAYSDRDFVVRGVDGEVYPCKKDIFRKTYELGVNGTPERLKNE